MQERLSFLWTKGATSIAAWFLSTSAPNGVQSKLLSFAPQEDISSAAALAASCFFPCSDSRYSYIHDTIYARDIVAMASDLERLATIMEEEFPLPKKLVCLLLSFEPSAGCACVITRPCRRATWGVRGFDAGV